MTQASRNRSSTTNSFLFDIFFLTDTKILHQPRPSHQLQTWPWPLCWSSHSVQLTGRAHLKVLVFTCLFCLSSYPQAPRPGCPSRRWGLRSSSCHSSSDRGQGFADPSEWRAGGGRGRAGSSQELSRRRRFSWYEQQSGSLHGPSNRVNVTNWVCFKRPRSVLQTYLQFWSVLALKPSTEPLMKSKSIELFVNWSKVN